MGCVYLAVNLVNGKRYVGKTVGRMYVRRRSHIRESVSVGRRQCRAFHSALRKYGVGSFKWSVLYVSDDERKLHRAEKRYIRRLMAKAPNGYNLTDGGEGVSGMAVSEKTRALLSLAGKGRVMPVEVRLKLSRLKKGKKTGQKHSLATRLKMSLAHKGKKYKSMSAVGRLNIGKSQKTCFNPGRFCAGFDPRRVRSKPRYA